MESPLNFLIAASRYKLFKKRVLRFPDDINNYHQAYNGLQEFIRLCPWETECLYYYSAMSKKGIVEIGRYNGGSTLVFALCNPTVNIISIDINPQNDGRLNDIFKKLGVGQNVKLIVDDASNYSKSLQMRENSFDFLFIDGDHSYEACLRDIQNFYPHLETGGLIAFHDSYPDMPNNGVFHAIQEFSSNQPGMQQLIPISTTTRVWENQNGSISIFRKQYSAWSISRNRKISAIRSKEF